MRSGETNASCCFPMTIFLILLQEVTQCMNLTLEIVETIQKVNLDFFQVHNVLRVIYFWFDNM